MGMAVNDFYGLTPRQFANKLAGFTDNQNEIKQDTWERERFFTTALINIQLDAGKKINPEKLVKLPWDKEKKKEVMTADEFIRVFDIKEKQQ